MPQLNQPNTEKKELCLDKEVQKTFGDMFGPTCRTEKCVYISTKKV